jgi:Domain of unknown function (DUF1707)
MDPRMRASDTDREHVVATMREQVGTGRLTLEEFSARSATAYQASTIGELDTLTRDLPRPTPASASAPVLGVRSNLVPVLVVIVLVLLLAGTLFAITSLGATDSMGPMMNHMMGN